MEAEFCIVWFNCAPFQAYLWGREGEGEGEGLQAQEANEGLLSVF